MAVDLEWDTRPTRPCMSCGQSDKAPRDSVNLADGSVAYFHKDCHAMLGCKVCQEELELVAGGSGPKGKKNEQLLEAILTAMDPNTGDVPDFYTRDDVTGTYQSAVDEGMVLDKTWEGGSK